MICRGQFCFEIGDGIIRLQDTSTQNDPIVTGEFMRLK